MSPYCSSRSYAQSIGRTSRILLALALASQVSCSRMGRDTGSPEPLEPNITSKTEHAPEPERVYPEPPGPEDPRPTNFPDLQKFELGNRLQVVVVESHDVPLVDVQLVLNVGDIHDELLTATTANLLTRGTTKRSKTEMDEQLARLGSSLAVSFGTHETTVSAVVLKPHLSETLEIVGDVARNPRFEPEIVEVLREQQASALRQAKSSAHALGNTLLFMKLYPEGHPYGRPFIREEKLGALGVQTLEEFHDLWYRPNNARLILSGAITLEEAKTLARKIFDDWKPRNEEFPPYPLRRFASVDYQEALPTKYTIHIVDRPSASTEVLIGNLALARDDSNWEKMEIVNRIFGTGPHSRLFVEGGLRPPPSFERERANGPREHWASDAALRLILESSRASAPSVCHDTRSTIGDPGSTSKRFSCDLWDLRDNRRLTHHVGSRVTRAKAVGAFHVATQTNEVDVVLGSVFEQIDRIHGKLPRGLEPTLAAIDRDPSEAEFERARREIVQALTLQIETASQVAQRVRTQLTFGLPDTYWRTYPDRLDAMQREEVKEIAKRYIHPIPVIVLVGEAQAIKQQLARVDRLRTADILVYDTNLEPMP